VSSSGSEISSSSSTLSAAGGSTRSCWNAKHPSEKNNSTGLKDNGDCATDLHAFLYVCAEVAIALDVHLQSVQTSSPRGLELVSQRPHSCRADIGDSQRHHKDAVELVVADENVPRRPPVLSPPPHIRDISPLDYDFLTEECETTRTRGKNGAWAQPLGSSPSWPAFFRPMSSSTSASSSSISSTGVDVPLMMPFGSGLLGGAIRTFTTSWTIEPGVTERSPTT
jgi:hypothetical protein